VVSSYATSEPLVVDGKIKENIWTPKNSRYGPGDMRATRSSRTNLLRKSPAECDSPQLPCLAESLGCAFITRTYPQILYFARYQEADPVLADGPRFGQGVRLVAISLDPFKVGAEIEVPVWEWQLGDDARLQVEDLMTGHHLPGRADGQQSGSIHSTPPFASLAVACAYCSVDRGKKIMKQNSRTRQN